jgi:hypothetical protein
MVTTQPGIGRSPRHGVSSARSAHRNETVWRSLRGMAREVVAIAQIVKLVYK